MQTDGSIENPLVCAEHQACKIQQNLYSVTSANVAKTPLCTQQNLVVAGTSSTEIRIRPSPVPTATSTAQPRNRTQTKGTKHTRTHTESNTHTLARARALKSFTRCFSQTGDFITFFPEH